MIILIFYTTSALLHTNIHPTQQFISIIYTDHFKSKRLDSTSDNCTAIAIIPLLFHALPKDYGECMVSEIGGNRLLVLIVCII